MSSTAPDPEGNGRRGSIKLTRSHKPLVGLLAQSGLGRFADYMAGVVYGWGVLQNTGSSFGSGLVIATHLGALLVGTLFAGRLIARFGARRVALTGAWAGALSSAAVASLLIAGEANPFLIAVIAAAGAILDGPSNIASETNYPEVARIARWNTLKLNAFDDGLDNAAALFGPASGAALVAAIGVNGAAGVIAALALASAILITLALPGFRNPGAASVPSLGRVMRFMRADKILFPLAVLTSVVVAIFISVQLVVLPVAAKQAGDGPSVVAAFLSTGAAGGMVGALLTVSLRERLTLGPLVAIAYLGLALGVALLATGIELWRVIAAGFLAGLPAGATMPAAITLFQTRPTRAMRADVQAIGVTLVFASAPVALMVVGALAEVRPIFNMLIGMSLILIVIAAAALVWLPHVSLQDAARTAPHGLDNADSETS